MKKNRSADPKLLFSKKSTEKAIELCNKIIKNKQARKQTIMFIKAVDGKRIRNKSGV